MDEEYTDRMYELIEDGTNFLYKKIKEENLIERPVVIVKSNRNENEYIVHEDIRIISLIRQKGRKYFRIAKDENSINITPRRRKDILYINQEDLKKLLIELTNEIQQDNYQPIWQCGIYKSVISSIQNEYPQTKNWDWDNIPEYRSMQFDNWREDCKEKIKKEISLRKEYVELLDLKEDYINGTITITVKADDDWFDFLADVFRYDDMRLTKEKDNKIIIYNYTKK